MNYTDGKAHDLNYFDDVYAQEEVTAENYTSEVSKGIYTYIGALTVPEGSKKIVFYYRNEEGTLLKSDTVPVLYSVKGDDGTSYYVYYKYSANSDGTNFTDAPQTDSKYQGIYTGTSETAPTEKESYTWAKYVGEDGTSLNNKGTWETGKAYSVNDYVYYEENKNSYVCKSAVSEGSSITPLNSNYWTVLAAQGETGSSATQYYIHYVYNDSKTSASNYSKSETRKYVGVYVDTTEADADDFATANAKEGIVWSQIEGDQGIQGGAYKGCYTSASGLSDSVKGDTYLNKTDGYLYEYNGTSWSAVTDYTDTRYKQAINDMIANAGNTSYSADFMTVVNLWVSQLTAQTALINSLFAKTITLQSGGVITSEYGVKQYDQYDLISVTAIDTSEQTYLFTTDQTEWTSGTYLLYIPEAVTYKTGIIYSLTPADYSQSTELNIYLDGALYRNDLEEGYYLITVDAENKKATLDSSTRISDSNPQELPYFYLEADSGKIKAREAVLKSVNAVGGTFKDITSEGGTFTDATISGSFYTEKGIYYNSNINESSTKDFISKMYTYVMLPMYWTDYEYKMVNGTIRFYCETESLDALTEPFKMEIQRQDTEMTVILYGSFKAISGSAVSIGYSEVFITVYADGSTPEMKINLETITGGTKTQKKYNIYNSADSEAIDATFKGAWITC